MRRKRNPTTTPSQCVLRSLPIRPRHAGAGYLRPFLPHAWLASGSASGPVPASGESRPSRPTVMIRSFDRRRGRGRACCQNRTLDDCPAKGARESRGRDSPLAAFAIGRCPGSALTAFPRAARSKQRTDFPPWVGRDAWLSVSSTAEAVGLRGDSRAAELDGVPRARPIRSPTRVEW